MWVATKATFPMGSGPKVGTVVWSTLGGGALSGKLRRGQAAPEGTRLAQNDFLAGTRSDKLYDIVDELDRIAAETGKTVSQVALRWVLQRPSVVNIVVGARNEAQLRENLGAIGWSLDDRQMARLDAASEVRPIYPYWHQRQFAMINPPLVPVPAPRKE